MTNPSNKLFNLSFDHGVAFFSVLQGNHELMRFHEKFQHNLQIRTKSLKVLKCKNN